MTGGKLNGGIMAWNSTIDIGGGTIECSKSLSSGYYDKCLRLYVTNDVATCTITGGTFIDTYGKQVISSEGNGELNIQGGTFRSTSTLDTNNLITVEGTDCNISGGNFRNDRLYHAAVAVKGNSALHISNGSFLGTGKAIAIESASSVNITGGIFTSNCGIWIRNDSTTSPITISLSLIHISEPTRH